MTHEPEFRNFEAVVIDTVETLVASRLDRAAARLAEQVVWNISRNGIEGSLSDAGDFPRKETGALSGSITINSPERLTRQVLTDEEHGLLLEIGTPVMARHPYLTRTLDEMSIELGAIIAEGRADQ